MFRGETRQAKLRKAMAEQESPKRRDMVQVLCKKSSECNYKRGRGG